MKIDKWKLKIALPVIVILLGCASYYIYSMQGREAPYKVPVLNQAYENEKHGFALTMPEGFTARETTTGDSDTIVFEDDKSNGIQIVISPFEDIKELSADRIRADIPDMQIKDPEPVEIGNSHKGLAFKSDNQAFDGASREVWFVFNSELYQISTYEKFDDLLKQMFGTWQFNVK